MMLRGSVLVVDTEGTGGGTECTAAGPSGTIHSTIDATCTPGELSVDDASVRIRIDYDMLLQVQRRG